MVILIVTQFVTLCNVVYAASQMTWSMARDGALIPHAKFWYALDGKHQVPVRIMLMIVGVAIIVIMPVSYSLYCYYCLNEIYPVINIQTVIIT